MRFLERVFIFLFIFGVAGRLFHWQGYDVFWFIAILGLAWLYFSFGFLLYTGIRIQGIFKKESYRLVPVTNFIIAIVAGIIHCIMLIGILFKIQHWPGGRNMLSGGLMASLILSILAFLVSGGAKSKLFLNILGRTLVIVVISLSLLTNPFSLFR